MATNNLTVPARDRLTSILEGVASLIKFHDEHPEYFEEEGGALQIIDGDVWNMQDRICERNEGKE